MIAETLTARQVKVLTKARNAIRDQPETYNQATYGTSRISCNTPACVAGHIAAANGKLREHIARLRGWRERRGATEMVAEEIRSAAIIALGLAHGTKLFEATWPITWRPADSRTPRDQYAKNRFTPTAEDAVKVLDAILEGRNSEALRRG